jgi:hypothetical protein
VGFLFLFTSSLSDLLHLVFLQPGNHVRATCGSGGDLLGNVWRFDIDNAVPPSGKEATLIAELGQVNGAGIQPITIKPELTEIYDGGADHAVVKNIAAGRYLGLSDWAIRASNPPMLSRTT